MKAFAVAQIVAVTVQAIVLAKSLEEQTKLVIEVSRHGARASETIYNLTANASDNF
jgi:hypothetical protein